jgi:hypothetical protein
MPDEDDALDQQIEAWARNIHPTLHRGSWVPPPGLWYAGPDAPQKQALAHDSPLDCEP